MPHFDTLQADLNAARKALDQSRVHVRGTIVSDAGSRRIELRRDLADDEVFDGLRIDVMPTLGAGMSCAQIRELFAR